MRPTQPMLSVMPGARAGCETSGNANAQTSALARYPIIRRNGSVVPFEPDKIAAAMMKAFLAVYSTQDAASTSVRETVDDLTQGVIRALVRSRPSGGTFHIEDMPAQATDMPLLHAMDGGNKVALDLRNLQALTEAACADLGAQVIPDPIVAETCRNRYDGVPIDEVYKASILAALTLIEKEPDHTYATARLQLHTVRREVLGEEVSQEKTTTRYAGYFPQFTAKGVKNELLDERLQQFDLARLGAALKPERNLKFDYLGLQTLYARYFLHLRKQRVELPQAFFMRFALNEINRNERAIEFHELLSSFDFMSGTPTLFNAGTLRSQLSSCCLTAVFDGLGGIYDATQEKALLSKFAGGLGARTEDHLLPVHHERQARREIHRRSRQDERGFIGRRCSTSADGHITGHGHQVLRHQRFGLRGLPIGTPPKCFNRFDANSMQLSNTNLPRCE